MSRIMTAIYPSLRNLHRQDLLRDDDDHPLGLTGMDATHRWSGKLPRTDLNLSSQAGSKNTWIRFYLRMFFMAGTG